MDFRQDQINPQEEGRSTRRRGMSGMVYRIRYCDPDGREVPVYEAALYRVYLRGRHVRDFPYLSAATKWIKAQSKEGGRA
jgi:hypothetical protein